MGSQSSRYFSQLWVFMQINIAFIRYVPLLVCASLVLAVTFAVMSYVYGFCMYPCCPSRSDTTILAIIIFIMLGSLVSLWVLFPSKLAIGVVTLVCAMLPLFVIDNPCEGEYATSRLIDKLHYLVPIACIFTIMSVGIAHWRQKIDRLPRS